MRPEVTGTQLKIDPLSPAAGYTLLEELPGSYTRLALITKLPCDLVQIVCGTTVTVKLRVTADGMHSK